MKLTKEQEGGFLGALDASVGIPLLMNTLTGKLLPFNKGKGLQLNNGRRLRVLSTGASSTGYYQMAQLTGFGNKNRQGLLLGKNFPI